VTATTGRAAGYPTRRLRRAVARHRRLVAAGLAAAAVLAALTAVRPAAPATATVWVAARDLSGGVPLSAGDLRPAAIAHDLVPAGAVPDGAAVAGRTLAAPLRRGEALTDVRLVGGALAEGYGAGLVAAPVRLADGAAAALLRPGDLIDVLAADPPTELGAPRGPERAARTVAVGARVALVPGGRADGARDAWDGGGAGGLGGGLADAAGDAAGGGLVVLAVPRSTAARLAQAAATSRLSVVLRPG
jgi:Flp pilus assembly protein CpaB